MFTVIHLDPTYSHFFCHLTYKQYRSRLLVLDNKQVFACGTLTAQGHPIGLVLAEKSMEKGLVTLLSIYVRKEYRCQGIGKALLQALQNQVQSHSYSCLEAVYIGEQSNTAALQALFNSCGWFQPMHYGNVYRLRLIDPSKEDSGIPWWVKAAAKTTTIRFFRWQDLSPEEEIQIKNTQQETGWYPEYLSPFSPFDPFSPVNSLGFRKDGMVAGWMITRRIAHDTLLYQSYFMRENTRNSPLALRLLMASAHLQVKADIPYAMFSIDLANSIMQKIATSWLIPYSVSIMKRLQTYIYL